MKFLEFMQIQNVYILQGFVGSKDVDLGLEGSRLVKSGSSGLEFSG